MKKLIIFCIITGLLVTACGRRDEAEAESETETVAQAAIVTPTASGPAATSTPLPTPKPRTEIVESPVQQPVTDSQASSPIAPPANSDAMSPLAGSEELVAKAKELLIQTPGVRTTAADISLLSMESRDWSDGSLGCPKEGQMYTQAITPGFLILLEANGEVYEFHSNMRDHVVPCFEGEK